MDQYSNLELSTQILIKDALARGISVEVLDERDNIIRLKKNGKIEYIKQATKTSADSYIVPLLMENKQVTKLLLDEKEINVPRGLTICSVDDGLKAYDAFKGTPIVVKPNSTNFGKGVVVLVENYGEADYRQALEEAFDYDSTVIIEEFFRGKEYRFLVIGNEVAGVVHRVPANVEGDGVHTIRELVDEKNRDPRRGKGYKTPLEKIRLGQIEKGFLRQQGLEVDYVPAVGEIVYLRENSNVSTGGDSIDYTDEVHPGYKDIAVEAAKVVGAQICGIDIMIKDEKEEPSDENYCVIELNFNPAIHMHEYPYKGKNRNIGNKILNLLGF